MRLLRCLTLLSVLVLPTLAFAGSQPAVAQQLASARITDFEVTTLDGRSVKDVRLMAGATYKVDFNIEVAAGLKEDFVLKTSLERASGTDRFWTLTGDYSGIDSESWQPGQPSFSFKAVEGTAQLELVGNVPQDYVSESSSEGENLNIGRKISIVELSLESGTVIDDRQIEVVTSSIEEYLAALHDKNSLLENTEAEPAYSELVQALIASAEAEAKLGYTDLAMETLNTIPDSGWVKPQGSAFYQWIILGVLAVIAGASMFLYMRARGEIALFRMQSDSQAKNLQILAKKASRIGDPSLTSGIQQLLNDLEQS